MNKKYLILIIALLMISPGAVAQEQEQLTYDQWVGETVAYAKVCQKFFRATYEGNKAFHIDKIFAHNKEYNDQLLKIESYFLNRIPVQSAYDFWMDLCEKDINEALDQIIKNEREKN